MSLLPVYGWGAVICKTVSLDAAKVVNVQPRYARLRSRESGEIYGWENIELISDRSFDTWINEFKEVKSKYPDRVLIASIMEEYNPNAWQEIVGRCEEVNAYLLADEVYFQLAETFRALADSTRAKIVYSLLRQELCTCDLAAIVGASESAVSQHLRVLRQLRLVKNRRAGKQVFYSLDDAHIRILLSVCLSHVRDAERSHAGMDNVLALFAEEG